jgi:hypothetical protein
MEFLDVQFSLGIEIVRAQFIIELYTRVYQLVKHRFRAQKNVSRQGEIKKRITDFFPPQNSIRQSDKAEKDK